MRAEVKRLVDQVMKNPQTNPPMAASTQLQMLLAGDAGIKTNPPRKITLTMDDLIDAGRYMGMDDDEIGEFIEEQASWLTDAEPIQ